MPSPAVGQRLKNWDRNLGPWPPIYENMHTSGLVTILRQAEHSVVQQRFKDFGRASVINGRITKHRYNFGGEELYGVPIETVIEPYPLQGRVTLSKKAPTIAAQWFYEKNSGFHPEDFSYGSGVNAWWRCDEGPDHVWRQRICVRTATDSGCPCCAGQKVSVTNSLARLYPDISKEWHPHSNTCKPAEITAHSDEVAFWQCPRKKAHVWAAAIAARTSPRGSGCPHCLAERRDGLKSFPNALKYFDSKKNKGIDPFRLPIGKKVWWRCPAGKDHIWIAGVQRKQVKEHCPFCRGYWASSTNNLTLNRTLMAEFDKARNKPINPSTIPLGSMKQLWWRCKTCGHSWKTSVQLRVSKGYGCRMCAAKARRKK